MTKLGRISNGALNALQRNPKDQTEVNTSSRRVARQVLIYLESADKKCKNRAIHSAMVRFLPGTADQATILRTNRLQKISLFRFSIRKKEKSLQSILAKNGYIVTMIAGKEPTIVKDGNCLPSSEKISG